MHQHLPRGIQSGPLGASALQKRILRCGLRSLGEIRKEGDHRALRDDLRGPVAVSVEDNRGGRAAHNHRRAPSRAVQDEQAACPQDSPARDSKGKRTAIKEEEGLVFDFRHYDRFEELKLIHAVFVEKHKDAMPAKERMAELRRITRYYSDRLREGNSQLDANAKELL